MIFQRALSRNATQEEKTLAVEFLQRHRELHAAKFSDDQAVKLAVADLCRAVLNLNEFIYID